MNLSAIRGQNLGVPVTSPRNQVSGVCFDSLQALPSVHSSTRIPLTLTGPRTSYVFSGRYLLWGRPAFKSQTLDAGTWEIGLTYQWGSLFKPIHNGKYETVKSERPGGEGDERSVHKFVFTTLLGKEIKVSLPYWLKPLNGEGFENPLLITENECANPQSSPSAFPTHRPSITHLRVDRYHTNAWLFRVICAKDKPPFELDWENFLSKVENEHFPQLSDVAAILPK